MLFFILYVLSGGPPRAGTEEPGGSRHPAIAEHTSTVRTQGRVLLGDGMVRTAHAQEASHYH